MIQYDIELEALATEMQQAGDIDSARALRALASVRRLDWRYPHSSATRDFADWAEEAERELQKTCRAHLGQ